MFLFILWKKTLFLILLIILQKIQRVIDDSSVAAGGGTGSSVVTGWRLSLTQLQQTAHCAPSIIEFQENINFFFFKFWNVFAVLRVGLDDAGGCSRDLEQQQRHMIIPLWMMLYSVAYRLCTRHRSSRRRHFDDELYAMMWPLSHGIYKIFFFGFIIILTYIFFFKSLHLSLSWSSCSGCVKQEGNF